jgi:hypothetical protein
MLHALDQHGPVRAFGDVHEALEAENARPEARSDEVEEHVERALTDRAIRTEYERTDMGIVPAHIVSVRVRVTMVAVVVASPVFRLDPLRAQPGAHVGDLALRVERVVADDRRGISLALHSDDDLGAGVQGGEPCPQGVGCGIVREVGLGQYDAVRDCHLPQSLPAPVERVGPKQGIDRGHHGPTE